MKSEGTTKVITNHPEGDISICTEFTATHLMVVKTFHSNPQISTSWWREEEKSEDH